MATWQVKFISSTGEELAAEIVECAFAYNAPKVAVRQFVVNNGADPRTLRISADTARIEVTLCL